LDAASTNLPGVMWAVVLVGAIIGLCSTFFFKVEDVRLHSILVTLLAVFMGLVIFMILALDRPFEGDLGIGPQPYQLIYDKLMKP
jgi:ribose/xylose/arabinose/galactoside ABC-type transport system permease subunit